MLTFIALLTGIALMVGAFLARCAGFLRLVVMVVVIIVLTQTDVIAWYVMRFAAIFSSG